MADGLLAGGGLGSEAMAPEPELPGWAAEEELERLEKGEHPPCWRSRRLRQTVSAARGAPGAQAFRTWLAWVAAVTGRGPGPLSGRRIGRYPGHLSSSPNLASASSRLEGLGRGGDPSCCCVGVPPPRPAPPLCASLCV